MKKFPQGGELYPKTNIMKQLNKETAEKLHAEIPSNIVTKFDLDINIDYRYGIFRFNNPKLEGVPHGPLSIIYF